MAKKKVRSAEKRNLLNHSDEVSDMFCESCFKDGIKNVSAVGFCANCVTFFCKTCLKFHTKFLPDHVQLNNNKMPIDFCQESCSTHKNEIVKYYCAKCDLLACSTCKANDHKECETVQYVPALLSEFEDKREYKSFEAMLYTVEEKLKETKKVIEKRYSHAEHNKEETEAVIKVCKENIDKLFGDLEREVIFKIDETSTENKTNLEKWSEKLSELETKFQSIKSEHESNNLTCQRCKRFTLVKSCRNVVKTIKYDIECLKRETGIQEMKFEPASVIRTTGDFGTLNIGKPGESQKLGNVFENLKPAERKQAKYSAWFWCIAIVAVVIAVIAGMVQADIFYNRYENVNELIANGSNNSHGSIVREEDIILSRDDINVDVNKDIFLTKICYLSRNYLIAIDGHNNLALLVSTVEKKIVSNFMLGKDTWDVTKVRKNQFAVTFYNSSEIHFIEFKKLHHSKTFSWFVIKIVNQGSKYISLLYRDEKIFTSTENEITIFDMNMNKLKTIYFNKTDTPVIGYHVTRMTGKTIHILSLAFTDSLKVLQVTADDVYESFYTNENLMNPVGLTTDEKGNVYVCRAFTKNVFMLSSDMTRGEELLNETDGLREPTSIAYSSEGKKLFIGQSFQARPHFISVFRFV